MGPRLKSRERYRFETLTQDQLISLVRKAGVNMDAGHLRVWNEDSLKTLESTDYIHGSQDLRQVKHFFNLNLCFIYKNQVYFVYQPFGASDFKAWTIPLSEFRRKQFAGLSDYLKIKYGKDSAYWKIFLVSFGLKNSTFSDLYRKKVLREKTVRFNRLHEDSYAGSKTIVSAYADLSKKVTKTEKTDIPVVKRRPIEPLPVATKKVTDNEALKEKINELKNFILQARKSVKRLTSGFYKKGIYGKIRTYRKKYGTKKTIDFVKSWRNDIEFMLQVQTAINSAQSKINQAKSQKRTVGLSKAEKNLREAEKIFNKNRRRLSHVLKAAKKALRYAEQAARLASEAKAVKIAVAKKEPAATRVALAPKKEEKITPATREATVKGIEDRINTRARQLMTLEQLQRVVPVLNKQRIDSLTKKHSGHFKNTLKLIEDLELSGRVENNLNAILGNINFIYNAGNTVYLVIKEPAIPLYSVYSTSLEDFKKNGFNSFIPMITRRIGNEAMRKKAEKHARTYYSTLFLSDYKILINKNRFTAGELYVNTFDPAIRLSPMMMLVHYDRVVPAVKPAAKVALGAKLIPETKPAVKISEYESKYNELKTLITKINRTKDSKFYKKTLPARIKKSMRDKGEAKTLAFMEMWLGRLRTMYGAQKAIGLAESAITLARQQGKDVKRAEELLERARKLSTDESKYIWKVLKWNREAILVAATAVKAAEEAKALAVAKPTTAPVVKPETAPAKVVTAGITVKFDEPRVLYMNVSEYLKKYGISLEQKYLGFLSDWSINRWQEKNWIYSVVRKGKKLGMKATFPYHTFGAVNFFFVKGKKLFLFIRGAQKEEDGSQKEYMQPIIASIPEGGNAYTVFDSIIAAIRQGKYKKPLTKEEREKTIKLYESFQQALKNQQKNIQENAIYFVTLEKMDRKNVNLDLKFVMYSQNSARIEAYRESNGKIKFFPVKEAASYDRLEAETTTRSAEVFSRAKDIANVYILRTVRKKGITSILHTIKEGSKEVVIHIPLKSEQGKKLLEENRKNISTYVDLNRRNWHDYSHEDYVPVRKRLEALRRKMGKKRFKNKYGELMIVQISQKESKKQDEVLDAFENGDRTEFFRLLTAYQGYTVLYGKHRGRKAPEHIRDLFFILIHKMQRRGIINILNTWTEYPGTNYLAPLLTMRRLLRDISIGNQRKYVIARIQEWQNIIIDRVRESMGSSIKEGLFFVNLGKQYFGAGESKRTADVYIKNLGIFLKVWKEASNQNNDSKLVELLKNKNKLMELGIEIDPFKAVKEIIELKLPYMSPKISEEIYTRLKKLVSSENPLALIKALREVMLLSKTKKDPTPRWYRHFGTNPIDGDLGPMTLTAFALIVLKSKSDWKMKTEYVRVKHTVQVFKVTKEEYDYSDDAAGRLTFQTKTKEKLEGREFHWLLYERIGNAIFIESNISAAERAKLVKETDDPRYYAYVRLDEPYINPATGKPVPGYYTVYKMKYDGKGFRVGNIVNHDSKKAEKIGGIKLDEKKGVLDMLPVWDERTGKIRYDNIRGFSEEDIRNIVQITDDSKITTTKSEKHTNVARVFIVDPAGVRTTYTYHSVDMAGKENEVIGVSQPLKYDPAQKYKDVTISIVGGKYIIKEAK